jgi:hypothetical protein
MADVKWGGDEMAEGRMLKKTIAGSKKLALVNDRAKVIWFMMLPHADIEGRVKACPIIVRGQYLTMLNYSLKAVQQALEALHSAGLIALYQVDGNQYAEFTRFKDFQSLRPDREGESTIPPPDSGTTPGVIQDHSGLIKEVKEVKVSKVKKTPGKPEQFDEFWATYPKKRAKRDALNVWLRLDFSDGLFEKIIAAVAAQKKSAEWKKEGGQFIPYPATWLRKGRWDDESKSTSPQDRMRCRKCGRSVGAIYDNGLCTKCG